MVSVNTLFGVNSCWPFFLKTNIHARAVKNESRFTNPCSRNLWYKDFPDPKTVVSDFHVFTYVLLLGSGLVLFLTITYAPSGIASMKSMAFFLVVLLDMK